MSQGKIQIHSLDRDIETRLSELRRSLSALTPYRAVVESALQDGNTYYGINTGFGILAGKRISPDAVFDLQKNLVLSHSVGVGPYLPKSLCRLMLELKVHALGLGYSGISEETFERLLLFLEQDLIPAVPQKGSVGASGDLAPLAHMALPLIGEGEFWDSTGTKTIHAKSALKRANLSPLTLKAKEGLALLNGTQFMSAHGAYVLSRASRLVKLCDIIGAMSLEAARGSVRPFEERVQNIRPHPGQQQSARNITELLKESEIVESHRHCDKVQDPYSLRCMAVVHGASRGALQHATEVLEIEINSVTDNPLVFLDGSIVSAGNFHGQPVALALDYAAIALAELASISERRSYLLLSGYDGLPPVLLEQAGLYSGFMIPQYTQAALVSENKVLAHPASVDSIPTSCGQEDHVSMGSISATKLLTVFENVEQVLGIELLLAAQALDFRKPLRPGRGVEVAYDALRSRVSHRKADKGFQEDFAKSFELIRSNVMLQEVEAAVGELL